MDMNDICDATFYERTAHFLNGVLPPHASMEERYSLQGYAESCASNEMLDEIHFMLRELLKKREENAP